ncbi:MAG TPA: hypothetical protein VFH73_29045 [Polyangia bacterium]|jgi:hypothetical protein|nr:hypothetical protein [Polyangia bacterium]
MATPAPPANPLIRKLVALLRSDAPEKQIAAAIVLGELEARDAAVVDGLLALADNDVGPVQRHALESLARIASRLPARSTLPRVMPLLAARDQGVRAAAVGVVIGLGDAAIAAVRERLRSAEADERRALEEILARLGGKDAFSALLANLHATDAEGARAVTLAVRQQLKTASARERKSALGQVTRFVGLKTTQASPVALAGALRIIGFIEDPASVARLLSYAVGKKVPGAVREEALIALRFALRPGGAQARLADKLLGVAETAPIGVARTALYTLAGVTLPPVFVKRLARLCDHSDGERALLAIERLAQMPGPQASEALGRVLLATKERARAEAAGTALTGRPDAAAALARALCVAPDENRAWMLAKMLRPHVRTLDKKTVRAVIEAGMIRLRGGTAGWEAFLQTAREADAPAVAKALRDEAEKLRRSKKTERALAVLRTLGRSAEATPNDGYVWAALELTAGRRDEAFVIFDQLLDRGFDVATAMQKDRTLALDQRYHVGFHFAEKRHPLGEEVLTAVADAGGRTKIAKMARAKLKSAGFEG